MVNEEKPETMVFMTGRKIHNDVRYLSSRLWMYGVITKYTDNEIHIQVRKGGNVEIIRDIVTRLLDDRNIGYEYKLYTHRSD